MIEIVEASYQLGQDTRAWLAGILEAARPRLDRRVGLVAACYDARDFSRLRMLSVAGDVPMPLWSSAFRIAAARLSAREVQRSFGSRPFGTVSGMLGDRFLETNVFARSLRLFGLHDALGINALDPTGFGCIVGAGLPERQASSPGLAELMAYVGAHIAAGHRLRRQIEQAKRGNKGTRNEAAASAAYLLQSAEAILSPDGRVTHATEATRGLAERLMLRAAAASFDRARRRRRRADPAATLAEWKALVGGCWSVVDCFDSDGRRFLIANRNDPRPDNVTDPLAALTRRERQVAGYAALGHANKVIAYELGISASSVATHLAQAATKLGARSRADLIARTCWRKGLRAEAAREAAEKEPRPQAEPGARACDVDRVA
jgi:DNA-binding CsgD family transcriptional regulator